MTSFREVKKIGSRQVSEWCITNSVRAIQKGLQYWALGGLSHLRNKTVLAEQSESESSVSANFRMASSENELVTLDDIYRDIEMTRSGISLLEKRICTVCFYEFKLCDFTTVPEECALSYVPLSNLTPNYRSQI